MKRYLISALALFLIPSFAFAVTAGPNSPTAATVALTGDAWANPTNVFTSNAIFSTANGTGSGGSNYLKITGFGFAIPTGATINGILVESQRQGTNCFGVYQLLKASAFIGSILNGTNDWPASESYDSIGGSSNLWGTTWTVSDVNNSGFGVAIQGVPDAFSAYTCSVDHVRISVTYTPAASVAFAPWQFSDF